MQANKVLFIFIIYSMLIVEKITAQAPVHIYWSQAAVLPDLPGERQLGIAGPFAGLSNGVILIAGGSNFPGAKPWAGGEKAYKNEIYMLKRLPGNKLGCTVLPQHLARKVAYGASVSTRYGVVCIGGETDGAGSSNQVFIMQWMDAANKVSFRDLPSLPVSVANACASCIDDAIYVFGGESKGRPIDKCFKLDLNVENSPWESLPPLPAAMSHSVAVTQSNGRYPCIYIVGGRSATTSGISQLHNSTFCYDPLQKKWLHLSDIGDGVKSTTLSAATAVALGHDRILLVGGDKGEIFHKIEGYNAAIAKADDEKEKQVLLSEKLELVTHHPGFSRDVYLYSVQSNKWEKLDALPFSSQVTTVAVKWGGEIFIPGGEIMPGRRTAVISRGTIKE